LDQNPKSPPCCADESSELVKANIMKLSGLAFTCAKILSALAFASSFRSFSFDLELVNLHIN
jgi:hypothetical protein